jgi:hypothetical protein
MGAAAPRLFGRPALYAAWFWIKPTADDIREDSTDDVRPMIPREQPKATIAQQNVGRETFQSQ